MFVTERWAGAGRQKAAERNCHWDTYRATTRRRCHLGLSAKPTEIKEKQHRVFPLTSASFRPDPELQLWFISTWKSKSDTILWKTDAMQWDMNFKTVLGLFCRSSQVSFNTWKIFYSVEEPLKFHVVFCHGRAIIVCFSQGPGGASEAINAGELQWMHCTARGVFGRIQ